MVDLEFTAPIHCYDGAYDSRSQRVIDAQVEALRLIQLREPEAHVTFFPVEGEWVVHSWGRELSAYHETKGSALADALRRLDNATA